MSLRTLIVRAGIPQVLVVTPPPAVPQKVQFLSPDHSELQEDGRSTILRGFRFTQPNPPPPVILHHQQQPDEGSSLVIRGIFSRPRIKPAMVYSHPEFQDISTTTQSVLFFAPLPSSSPPPTGPNMVLMTSAAMSFPFLGQPTMSLPSLTSQRMMLPSLTDQKLYSEEN